MTNLKIATFNVKNLIGPEQEFYRFERYTEEEYAWKKNWLARQLLTLNADVVCFQEIFDEEALWDVISETNRRGEQLNEVVLPGEHKSYRGKAIFDKLGYFPYQRADLRGLAAHFRLRAVGVEDLPQHAVGHLREIGRQLA